jgi:hypothetical protein
MARATKLHTNKLSIVRTGGALAVILLAACSISTNRGGKEGDKRVDIESPFGGLHVRTDIDAAKEIGIAVYPGARPKKDKDSEHGSANVNIASSLFGLKVIAASFESDDPPEKVLDFYRKELKPYGSVLECHGHDRQNVRPGESKELTCGDDGHKGMNIQVFGEDGTRLKVGTTDKQRVVEVKPHGSGSEFGLVYVQTRGKGESI